MVYTPGDYPNISKRNIRNKKYPSYWYVPIIIFVIITVIQIIWLCKTTVICESSKRGIFENLVFWGAFWIIAILYLCIEGEMMIVWITIAVITIFPIICYLIVYWTGDLNRLYNLEDKIRSKNEKDYIL